MSGGIHCRGPKCGRKLGARRADWALATTANVVKTEQREDGGYDLTCRCGRVFVWHGRVMQR